MFLVTCPKSNNSFLLTLCIFNCSISYLLWLTTLSIIGWFTCINPISYGTSHGWNRCKCMMLFTIYYSLVDSSSNFYLFTFTLFRWQKDTATVISTMLFLSGITTILHSYFGTRLPLVQGSSFVYLAPALVVINAQEYRNLTEHVSSYYINRKS